MFRLSIISVALLIAVAGCDTSEPPGDNTTGDNTTGNSTTGDGQNQDATGLTQTVSIKVPGMT